MGKEYTLEKICDAYSYIHGVEIIFQQDHGKQEIYIMMTYGEFSCEEIIPVIKLFHFEDNNRKQFIEILKEMDRKLKVSHVIAKKMLENGTTNDIYNYYCNPVMINTNHCTIIKNSEWDYPDDDSSTD